MTYNMTIEQIKSLLSRFYEGQTTPEEERLLAAYLHREDVPEELQEDKQLFLMLAQISDQEMPADIAEEITAFVNNLGQMEKEPNLSDSKQRKEIIYRLKTPPKMFYRVAATVAILVAIGGGIIAYQRQTDPFRDTCKTPEEAAQEILYADEIVNRSFASFRQSTDVATMQVNAMTETISKVNRYINY